MNKLILTMAALVLSAGTAVADPVEGVWQTQVDDGAYAHVTFKPCGANLCGTITRTFRDNSEYKSPNIGKPIVWDMAPGGGGSYSGGKIWQPSSGKVYKSKMALSGNALSVSGCVGPICKKQTWQRVK
ncbi:hypothetical protein GCM10011360_13320 [Primorskyibacter flagellatus]|uniref:DUF2147 domain-containing protein n=1 Tax=Primorskyibacter flagellatus TaxID=1387277 RepID=A0A917A6J0_9RHOB|nr:DUF2147 domain-containing protein [Primorskyibacter flagellatus]GGE26271.1 hypothetical protein GCM10011360_13320 [Primorskyibacter flagellatus]